MTALGDAIRARDDELVLLLQRLIRARSENPPGDESAPAAIVAAALEQLGADVRTFEPAPRRTSVVGVIEAGPGPALLCNAHLDTVPAGDGWLRAEPFSGALLDGRVYGRGTVDHKSPIAALLHAVEALRRLGLLRGRLVLVFDADEERGGVLGMHHLLERWDPRVEMALYAAPTSYGDDGARYFDVGLDNVVVASPGSVRLRAAYRSKVAYRVAPIDSWYPGEIAAAVAAQLAAERLPRRWFGGRTRARLVSGAAGEQVWDVAVLPGEELADVGARLRARIEAAVAELPRAEVAVETIESVPPASCPAHHPLVGALLDGAERATGRRPAIAALCTVTGMSPIQARLGIPVAAFGCGRVDLCHVPDESIAVDELVATAVTYAETLAALSERAGPEEVQR